MIKENLVGYFNTAIKENWDKPALSDYNGKTLLFKGLNDLLPSFTLLLRKPD